MNNELHTLSHSNTNFKEVPVNSGTDQHDQILDLEHSNWIAVGVEYVFIGDSVLSSTLKNHRIHTINLP